MPEYWDLYRRVGETLTFEKTGETVLRGQRLPEGTYHCVVYAWIRTEDGRYLIEQRAPQRRDPLCWEPPGGSVQAEETSEEAVIREVREEVGIVLAPGSGRRICRGARHYDGCDDFVDVWRFEVDAENVLRQLRLQPGEVNAAALMRPDEIRRLALTDKWCAWKQFDYSHLVL